MTSSLDNLVLEIYIYRPNSEVSILSHSQLIFLDQLMGKVFEMRYTLEDRVKVKAVIERAIRNTDILLRDAQNTADLMR